MQLAQRPDLSVEQAIQAALVLYRASPEAPGGGQKLATQLLLQLAQRPDLSVEQAIQAALAFYRASPEASEEQKLATQLLLQLAQRPDLSVGAGHLGCCGTLSCQS